MVSVAYLHSTQFHDELTVTLCAFKLEFALKLHTSCCTSFILCVTLLQEGIISTLQMQAQQAEQRAEAVQEAVKQPARSAVKLYITSALTAVLSFAVVSGTASHPVTVYATALHCCQPQCCHLPWR